MNPVDDLLNLLETLKYIVKNLEEWSAENQDLFLDEITNINENIEAMQDQTWKIGVNQDEN